jgi:hypothetical protein
VYATIFGKRSFPGIIKDFEMRLSEGDLNLKARDFKKKKDSVIFETDNRKDTEQEEVI